MLPSWSLLVVLGLGLPQPSVEWTDNAACPGAEIELEQAIGGYLNPDSAALVEVEVRLGLRDAGPAGLRLELQLDSAAGQERHQLAAIDCDRLIDQAAMLIAGAIDPFAYGWSPAVREDAPERHHAPLIQRPRSAEIEAPTPAPTPSPVEPDESPDVFEEFGPLESVEPGSERPKPPISGAISVGGTGFVGLFPDVGGGAEFEGALERGRLRWQTGASGWFGGRFRSDQADVGGNLWALALSSGLCGTLGGAPGATRIRVPLCGVAGAGFIHVRTVGTAVAREDIRPWAWAGVEGRLLILARENFAVGLGVGAMAALIRPAWEIQSPGVRFTVPPVMGVLRVTLEARELRRKEKSPGRRS